MSHFSLQETQRKLGQYIRSGKLEASSESLGESASHFSVLSKNGISANDRLLIYRLGYLSRLKDSLQEDYPWIRRVVGEAEFDKLLDDFTAKIPSESWTLADLSSKIPTFLAEYQPQLIERFAFLTDLARFEWLHILAEESANSEEIEFDSINALDPHEQLQTQLLLSPSVHLIQTDYALDAIKQRDVHISKTISPEKEWSLKFPKQSSRYCIYKSKDRIHSIPLGPYQWKILKTMESRSTVEQILSLSQSFSPELSPQTLTQWFSDWVARGIISGFSKPA